MNFKPRIFSFLLAFFLPFSAAAAEYTDGAIRLVLDGGTGRFSLYAANETTRQGRPLALFSDPDPRTSFLSVMVNDRSYRMGDASAFRTRLGDDSQNPSLIFESAFMTVTEEFSFVRTTSSGETNGVAITITLENRGDSQISAGARLLLDTNLGEGSRGFSFTTNLKDINSETLVTKADADNFWTDRNDKVSLSGSLNTTSPEDPDSVQFANWKRLNDAVWKAPYQEGRNFNFPPYSVGDSAVCYYYDLRPLDQGQKRTFGLYLVLNKDNNFSFPRFASGEGSIQDLTLTETKEQDLAALRGLMEKINAGIALGNVTEEEIAAIEFALNKLRVKYIPGGDPR